MPLVRIRADAIVAGPLAIFSGESDAHADRRAARDPHDRPLFEASAIAGGLRSAVAAINGDESADSLFGSLDGGPSKVVVHDPELRLPSGAGPLLPHRRWRNVIDRNSLATIKGGLFTDERWPSNLPYRFRFDVPAEDVDDTTRALRALSLPGLGIGSGPMPLRFSSIEKAPLSTENTHAAIERSRARWTDDWAEGWDDPWADDPVDDWSDVNRDTRDECFASHGALEGEITGVDVDLEWTLRGPLKTGRPLSPWESNSGEPDNELFRTEVVETGEIHERYGIAFSGVHGVLRQRAERYLASLAVPYEPDPRSATGLVADIFGSPGTGRDAEGNAGLLHTSDFLVTGEVSSTRRERLAIDRLTGGPYMSAKWTEALVPHGTGLHGKVSLRSHRLDPLPREAVSALAAALRDIHGGRAGIGAGTSVGNGEVELKQATITVHAAQCEPEVSRHHGPQLEWPDSIVSFITGSPTPSESEAAS